MAQMTCPAWTLTEVQPGAWWAIDTSSGTAFLLPELVAEGLWRTPDLQRQALSTILRNQNVSRTERFVDLEFLGVLIRYFCEEPQMADQILYLYQSMVPQLRRSPDVLVKLSRDV